LAKKNDDLENFLQKASDVENKSKTDTVKSVNLIDEAIKGSSHLGGRPEKKVEEKANKRLLCYVTADTKNDFTNKRGPISESKALGLLVDKYLLGEISL